MKRICLSLFCLFVCGIFPSYALEDLRQADEMIKSIVKLYMERKEIPGMTLGVVYGKQSNIYNFGFADLDLKTPVTQDTIFDLASITKVFTSTALALEIQNGKMTLKDPVTKFLSISNQNEGLSKVTLLDLATHTSSLPRVPPSLRQGEKYSSRKLMYYLEQWMPSYPVGTKFLYSNLGFGVLGYAIGNVNSQTYEDAIKDLITQPLGMTSTFIKIPSESFKQYAQGYSKEGNPVPPLPINAWPGGGALHSTSKDMLQFLKANLGVRGPPDLLKAMIFAQQPFFKVSDSLTMGLGWQRVERNGFLIIDKNGGVPGFSTYMGMIPEKKLGLVLMVNKGKGGSTGIGRLLLLRLAEEIKKFH
jgi:beta-lactamase class C